jgi:hypothetical protein
VRALIELVMLSLALGVVSRMWFARWLLAGLLAPAGRYFPTAYQLLRTPGNIVHEVGHAVGYLIAGHRVSGMRFWFNDPARRGYVQAGSPYAPWGHPYLARLVASPAPLLAGALALQACARVLEVPAAVPAAFRPGPSIWPEPARLKLAWQALTAWCAAPYGALELGLFVLLAVSLGIELAPSREDLGALAWPAVVLALMLLGIELVAARLPEVRAPLHWIDGTFAAAFHWLSGPLWWTLIALVGVGVLLTPVRLLIGAVLR